MKKCKNKPDRINGFVLTNNIKIRKSYGYIPVRRRRPSMTVYPLKPWLQIVFYYHLRNTAGPSILPFDLVVCISTVFNGVVWRFEARKCQTAF